MMEGGELRKNFGDMKDIVPDKGELQFGEVGTHTEKERFTFPPLLPEGLIMIQQHSYRPGHHGIRELGEGFEGDQGGVGAGVGFAAGTTEFTQFRGDGTREAVGKGQTSEVPGGGLDGEIVCQAEFYQGIEDRWGIAEHPNKLVAAGTAVVGRDIGQDLESAFLRAPFEDAGDNGSRPGSFLSRLISAIKTSLWRRWAASLWRLRAVPGHPESSESKDWTWGWPNTAKRVD